MVFSLCLFTFCFLRSRAGWYQLPSAPSGMNLHLVCLSKEGHKKCPKAVVPSTCPSKQQQNGHFNTCQIFHAGVTTVTSCKHSSVLLYNPVDVYLVIKHQVIIQQINCRSRICNEYSYPEMFRKLSFHSSTKSNPSTVG